MRVGLAVVSHKLLLSPSLSPFSTSSCFSAKTLKMIVSPYGCILVVFFLEELVLRAKMHPVSILCVTDVFVWMLEMLSGLFYLGLRIRVCSAPMCLLSCFSFYFFHFVEGVKEVAWRWDRKDSAYDCARNDWRNVRSRLRDQLPTAFRVSSLLGKETITERVFFLDEFPLCPC